MGQSDQQCLYSLSLSSLAYWKWLGAYRVLGALNLSMPCWVGHRTALDLASKQEELGVKGLLRTFAFSRPCIPRSSVPCLPFASRDLVSQEGCVFELWGIWQWPSLHCSHRNQSQLSRPASQVVAKEHTWQDLCSENFSSRLFFPWAGLCLQVSIRLATHEWVCDPGGFMSRV